MSFFFNEKDQKKIFLGYIPPGKAYVQAHKIGSNFGIIVSWIARMFTFLVKSYNETFKGLFLIKGQPNESLKSEYLFPDETFSLIHTEAHKSAYIRNHLMWGNLPYNFEGIAYILGITCYVKKHEDFHFDKQTPFKLPFKLPHRLGESDIFEKNTIKITFYSDEGRERFPLKFPVYFETEGLPVQEMKRIFETIRPAHMTIFYEETDDPNKIKQIPYDFSFLDALRES